MDVLRRHIINQNIAIHELKLTHSSKLIVIFPLIFISGDLNLEFQSEPKVEDAKKDVNSKCDFQKLLWKLPADIL